ncbi:MAG TPA: CoA transferase [Burkholderiales bacterium]|nr:CoA transferase [Burkholderiales bacterium]
METDLTSPSLLKGIRVLTLEQVHALPWGTAFLADLGAQVIRVESVEHLQDRKAGPFVDGKPGPEWWNEGANLAYFGTRNKQSLCLQVATPAGKEVFLKLVRNCDIVTDNFRPGTMKRYGFDHESLAQINPRIITLSSTAYGHTGPWSKAGSRARTVDSVSGMSYLTGFEGGPSARASNNYMDHSTGNNVAYALLLALYRRKRTGKGMRIDLSMQETGVSCIGPAILEAQRGIGRPRLGCAHLWKAPHNIYPCAGKDRWIAIAVSSDAEWTAMKNVMGNPEWARASRFDSIEGRSQNRHALDAKIAEWTTPQDDKALTRSMQAQGVCAGAVMTAGDLVDDPHMKQREFMQTIERAGGQRAYAGRPFRMPGLSMAIRHTADLGEHNETVLREVAGLTQKEISTLAADHVISNRPRAEEKVP